MSEFEKKLVLTSGPSECLAAIVAVYKSLGMSKDLAIFCMQELARRRILGEEFAYENYIEIETKKIDIKFTTDFVKVSDQVMSGMTGATNLLKLK